MTNKQDIIEQFITRHREALDAAPPDAHGWGTLERLLERLPDADALERQLLCQRPLLDLEETPPMLWGSICRQLDAAPNTDPLERFILKNRAALDTAEAPDAVWEKLSTSTPENNPQTPSRGNTVRLRFLSANTGRRLMRAAAALALLLTGAGIGMWYDSVPGKPAQTVALGEIAPEYAELEQYYIRDIHLKQQQLNRISVNEDHDVTQDLAQLDQMMEELRSELQHVPPANREKVVRALIENYKAKAAILERVLERLEQTNENPNSEEHEIDRI